MAALASAQGALDAKQAAIDIAEAAVRALEDEPAFNAGMSSVLNSDGKRELDAAALYDAVALLVSPEGADVIVPHKAVQDFISDAFAHCKFIAYVEAAQPLLEAAGTAKKLDAGALPLSTKKNADRFIQQCRALRLWQREPGTKPKDERPKPAPRRK